MSATEIIEQIKALPPSERAAVAKYVRTLPEEADRSVNYASSRDAAEAGKRVVSQYEDVFRKLSQ